MAVSTCESDTSRKANSFPPGPSRGKGRQRYTVRLREQEMRRGQVPELFPPVGSGLAGHLQVTLSSRSSEDSRAHIEKQGREACVNGDALSGHERFLH